MNAAAQPMDALKAPFPYFGGKSLVAWRVWERFGTVANYVEPFFGSGAVLLGAPWPANRIETVNDSDGLLCNAWRALASDPAGLAAVCDWPVSELDLHARGDWLAVRASEFAERLRGDPDYYDVKAAGWWIWGICAWIGSGWAVLGDAGQGINRKLPHLGDAGRGEALAAYFAQLAARLARVRICCGDWTRVMGHTPTVKQGLTGVFLDPPYCAPDRDAVYVEESYMVARDVQWWCAENGDNPLLRIALCGYAGDYDLPGWTAVPWKANGGFGSQGDGQGRANAAREMIWFSPHCLGGRQLSLVMGTDSRSPR